MAGPPSSSGASLSFSELRMRHLEVIDFSSPPYSGSRGAEGGVDGVESRESAQKVRLQRRSEAHQSAVRRRQ